MPSELEYVLGTHDDELTRLGIQHRAWRSEVLAAWQSAGIGRGQTVLDLGCGPGYAALDLAELVGPSGRVIAVDKSERFLQALDAWRRERNLTNITTRQIDLDESEFPGRLRGDLSLDAIWCRWVFAFVRKPRDIVARLASALRPGGSAVVHEYFHYSTWRTAPRCAELEQFVGSVMKSWRDSGGEPDIALSLPGWFEENGLELRTLRPIVDIIRPDHPKWEWARSFLKVGRQRLIDLGYMSAEDAEAVWNAFVAMEAAPGTRLITPAVLEIVAAKPRK